MATYKKTGQCSAVGCEKPDNAARGMCRTHYSRWRVNGDPNTLTRTPNGASGWARLERYVVPSEGCWEFGGFRDKRGYGRVGRRADGEQMAHRVSYEAFYGPIPVGLTIDHICRNRACVNPDHLQAVTQGENNRRSYLSAGEHMALGGAA